MAAKRKELKIIGRLELIDFPQWDLYDIDAKIDTGAYTSSLHCHHIKSVEKEDGEYVRFNLLDPSHETYNEKLFELPIHRKKVVKSSNGQKEERFVVKTKVQLFDRLLTAELSLTDRSEMRYPVLVGRKLISGRFLVDASKKYITKKETQEHS
ncbi:ATP-dependent zinc protease [Fodinibius sp. Rm-B-1B1-1]|uniref:ATP-dependent zinc protease family protein n=1 Tax=Fodinibius alkaliphilus TaxID=3140241 RepID=UPI00315A6E0D